MEYAHDSSRDDFAVRALTAQLHAANLRLAAASRETLRVKMVVAMVRAIHRLGIGRPIADDLAAEFLQVVIEQTLCDTGVLLQRGPERGEFTTIRAIGRVPASESEVLALPGAPPFLVLPGGSCATHVETELRRAFGAGPILWSLHRESGLALVLSSRVDATIRQSFEAANDREAIETALELYIDTLSHRRVNRMLVQERQSAETQALASKRMVSDLLVFVDSSLNGIVDCSRRIEMIPLDRVSSELLSEICAIGIFALQCRELLRVAGEVSALENVPLKTELARVEFADFINRSVKLIESNASKKDIRISVVSHDQTMTASVDPGWMTQILSLAFSQVIIEAERGSKVLVELSRRSEGLISIAVKWNADTHMGTFKADCGERGWRRPTPGGLTPDISRLVDAYGGTFIREVVGLGTEQMVVTLPTGN